MRAKNEKVTAKSSLSQLDGGWHHLFGGTICSVQDPQSLHKYAYVHGDPIGSIDPSGLLSASVSLSVGIGIASGLTVGGYLAFDAGYDFDDPEFWILTIGAGLGGALIGSALAVGGIGAASISLSLSPLLGILFVGALSAQIYSQWGAVAPDNAEQTKLNEALTMISNTPGYENVSEKLSGSDFEFFVWDKLPGAADAWANVSWWQNDAMNIGRNAFELPAPALAALIVHESVHTNQVPPISLFGFAREPDAYQLQSDFMRGLGYSGTPQEVRGLLTSNGYAINGKTMNWLTDQADSMSEYQTVNPAIYR